MSGGISAIKGFEYQAIVILACLFDHFDQHGPSAQARPEGVDDLDLTWTSGDQEHIRYIQIKKPREDNEGKLKPGPWTLSEVVRELLPNTINHLWDNSAEQTWIAGDEFHVEVTSLVSAGLNAPIAPETPYWQAVHALARNEALKTGKVKDPTQQSLRKWRVPENMPSDPDEAMARLTKEFGDHSSNTAAGEEFTKHYRTRAVELHARLPSILARTKIDTSYGATETHVKEHVCKRLEQQHQLPPAVIWNTLLHNLSGFIKDIAKQPKRRFNQEEFEFELRRIWPHMTPVRAAPLVEPNHISRGHLEDRLTTGWNGKALEVVGISGSGKTMLAAAAAQRSATVDPRREVYYAEVRHGTSLRDVLVGASFHLRRTGVSQPFAVSVDPNPADEEVLKLLARAYSSVPTQVLLLIDLVEGSSSNAFARDLATFVRALGSSALRLVILGQESPFRDLTPYERMELGAITLDIPGFRFEEFVTLVEQHHSKPDRAFLQGIFNRVTVGRAAGLFARLAHSLARAPSPEEMSQIAARPPDDMLAHAEQQRYARMTAGARTAAAKLVCFALPFRREDAEEIFPDDEIGTAIRELLTQGLLRSHDADSFEMHETVRAGLEGTLSLNSRRSAHAALANWYHGKGLTTTEIFHLEKAGKEAVADARAREVFLRGEHWASLFSYVLDRRLVTSAEIVDTIASGTDVEEIALLASILRDLAQPVAIDKLIELIRARLDRFRTNYVWAFAVSEAILEFSPTHLHDLILLSIENASTPQLSQTILGCLKITVLRSKTLIEQRTIELFNRQPAEIKWSLLPLLLLDGRRQALQPALAFLAAEPQTDEHRRAAGYALNFRDRTHVVEFLVAMPPVKTAVMLSARSPLLGSLAGLVWAHRAVLRKFCVEILSDSTADSAVLVNAIRVLVFVAEPSICSLCDPLLTRNDDVGAFAKLLPMLVPSRWDRSLYESRLLDQSALPDTRLAALYVLASIGANLDDLYQRVKAQEGDATTAPLWDFWFLMVFVRADQASFSAAPALLDTFMRSEKPLPEPFVIAALNRLNHLEGPTATRTLIMALGSSSPGVRGAAALALNARRSRSALKVLTDCYTKEAEGLIAANMAVAILASGPQSVSVLQGRPDSQNFRSWQYVLATRLRDPTLADDLVKVATDPSRHWQLRRAAIFAAGRLPHEIALERIAPSVMGERSPLTADRHINLVCHFALSSLLQFDASAMLRYFLEGRDKFKSNFGELLETIWSEIANQQDVPSGAELAGWLYDRLARKARSG